MKNIILLLFLMAYVSVIAQPPVHNVGALNTSNSDLIQKSVLYYPSILDASSDTTNTKIGKIIIVGEIEYKVLSGANNNQINEFAIGSTGRHLKLIDEKDIVKSAGIILNAQPISFSISNDTITATANIFGAGFVGQKVDANGAVYMGTLLEAYPNFQATLANHTALLAIPSPIDDHLYKVLDTSDDPNTQTGGGVAYYHYNANTLNGDRWITVLPYERGQWVIQTVIDSTRATVNYTAPALVSGLIGIVGTDNKTDFLRLLDYAVTRKNIKIEIPAGAFLITREHSDNFTKTSLLSECNILFKGQGVGITTIYFKGEPEDFSDNDLSNPPGPGIINGLFTFNQITQPTSNRLNVEFSDFSIECTTLQPFTTEGRLSPGPFVFIGNTNIETINLFNIELFSSTSLFYASDGHIKIQDCLLDGLKQSEPGIQQFGTAHAEVYRTKIKDIGINISRLKNNLKDPDGRYLYAHPQLYTKMVDCVVVNCHGLGQDFSGGGSDELPDKANVKEFIRCEFIVDDTRGEAIVFTGYYTSRVRKTKFVDCIFKNNSTNGSTMFALLTSSEMDVTRCEFFNAWVILFRKNVGTNNVFYNEEAYVFFDKCTFHNSRIDFYGNWGSQPENRIVLTDCITYFDGTGNSLNRIIQGDGTATRSKIVYNGGAFHGLANSADANLFFTESSNGLDLTFDGVHFNFRRQPASNECLIFKQLRNDVRVHFENCTAPDSVAIKIDYDGTLVNNITAKNNNFEGGLIYEASPTLNQKFELNTDLIHSDTLTAAATTKPTVYNAGFFNITGATSIDRLLFNGTENERGLIHGDFYVKAIGNDLTFTTGGNINSNFTVTNGMIKKLFYDSETQIVYDIY